MRNKQVVLLIAGISGIATGNNRQPEYPLYPSGAFLSRQPCRNCRFAVPYLFCFCCVFLWGQLWDGFRCLKYITAAGLDGNIGIFLLKCRMRRENKIKGGQE